MKLRAPEVAVAGDRGERRAIVGGRKRRRTIRAPRNCARNRRSRRRRHPSSSGSSCSALELIPAHVRNGPSGRGVQPPHGARQNAQALHRTFLGGLEQQLHPETDARAPGSVRARRHAGRDSARAGAAWRAAPNPRRAGSPGARLRLAAHRSETRVRAPRRSSANCSEARFAPPLSTMRTSSMALQHSLGARQFFALAAHAPDAARARRP